MKGNHILRWPVPVFLFFALPVLGQQQRPISERSDQSVRAAQATEPETPATTNLRTQDNQTTPPRLIKFSGVLTDLAGKPLSGPTEVTFKFYKQEADEDPLWAETQTIEADKEGRYTVLLGATQAEGIPVELFSSAEARWLGVEAQGQRQQPRTLLVSVPYALKAADAEKLAGKSVSDFVLTESLGEQVRQVIQAQGPAQPQSTLTSAPQQKQTAASTTASPQPPTDPPMPFHAATFTSIHDPVVLVTQTSTGAGLVANSAHDALEGFATVGNGVSGTTAGTIASGVAGFATSMSTSTPQNGVFGMNSGAGAGVAGIETNPNPSPNGGSGVFGLATGTNASGVAGFATSNSTSTFQNGVFGQNAGAGAGVTGIGTNPSTGVGVYGQSAFFTGVFGQTFIPDTNGVAGIANAATGSGNGVLGLSASTSGSGVFGNATATSGVTNGVAGFSASTGGTGTIGVATATSGNAIGMYGASASTGGNGMLGNAFATSGFTNGVYGVNSSTNGTGTVGSARATSGGTAGVVGQVFSPNGVAGQFANASGAGLILQGLSGPGFTQVFSIDANGSLDLSGNLVVHGATKSSTVKLQDGREVALYAVESPENWFEDFGSAELQNGVAWVPLEGSFAQAVNAALTYHVFLTANGDSNGLYVARKTPAGFEVREHGGGASNLVFDYRIVAKRRGFETLRLAEVQQDSKTIELSRQRLKELANSEALNRAGAVRMPRVAPLPAVPPVPPQSMLQVPKLSVPRPPQPR